MSKKKKKGKHDKSVNVLGNNNDILYVVLSKIELPVLVIFCIFTFIISAKMIFHLFVYVYTPIDNQYSTKYIALICIFYPMAISILYFITEHNLIKNELAQKHSLIYMYLHYYCEVICITLLSSSMSVILYNLFENTKYQSTYLLYTAIAFFCFTSVNYILKYAKMYNASLHIIVLSMALILNSAEQFLTGITVASIPYKVLTVFYGSLEIYLLYVQNKLNDPSQNSAL